MNMLYDLAQFRELALSLPVTGYPVGEPGPAGYTRIALFAATPSGGAAETTRAALKMVCEPGPFLDAVAALDADLRVYELDSGDPRTCLPEKMAAETIAYGMTAVEPGPELFCLGAVMESPPFLQAVSDGLAQGDDPLALLATHGGRDGAALFGALTAARMAGKQVFLEGEAALAAAAVLSALNPGAAGHCAAPFGSALDATAARHRIAAIPLADAGLEPVFDALRRAKAR